MGDENSQGLAHQVLYNLIRESDKTRDPAQQDSSTHSDAGTDMDPNRNETREDLEPRAIEPSCEPRTHSTDWKLSHTGSNKSLGICRTPLHNTI